MKTTSVTPTVSEQIIAFADIRGFHRQVCSQLSPKEIFEFLAEYYSIAQSTVAGSEGQIIKFIGDSVLLLFPNSNPDCTIKILKKLKDDTDSFLSRRGYDSRLCIKAHVGTVATGMIGEGDLERLDICGLAVNQTALLPNEEWILSTELQKKIKP